MRKKAARMNVGRILVAASFAILPACSGGVLFSCKTDQLYEVESPDKSRTAFVASSNCGATSSSTIEVSIVPSGDSIPLEGNALIVDKTPAFTEDLRPVWVDDRKIVLKYRAGARILFRSEVVDNVVIDYDELE